MTRRGALEWLEGYQRPWLRADLLAGLTAAAVVLPKAMAYATVAGLPVQAGLYTVLVPGVLYALFGTSRVLSVSTTSTLAILLAAELAHAGLQDLPMERVLATLTLLVGGVLIVAALLRLGFVADFISEPVLVGFKAGIGLVIVLDQIPKLLGVHIAKGGFFHNVLATAADIPHASLVTVAVGVLTMALLVIVEHRAPTAPAPLLAVAAGILASALLDLPSRGVAVVGAIPRGLPQLVAPDPALATLLWPGALGIALMSFTETIAASRAFARPGEPSIRPNRELGATGLANAAGAMFGALPAGGGTSQTAVNRLAGARSQLAGLVTALSTLLVMLLLAGPLGRMPQATLAAIVIVYSVGLIDLGSFRSIRRVRHMEFRWAIVALVGVVTLGTLQGILVAIIVSLVALAHQAADPPVYPLLRKPGTNVFRPRSDSHPEDESVAGLLLARVEGRIFFANAGRVGERLRELVESHRPRAVALDLSGVPDLEYSALVMLVAGERRLREQGIALHLVGLSPHVLEVVRRSTLAADLGRDRMHFTLEQAVEHYLAAPAPD